jgi:sugar lactone lactonase YvrE
LILVKPNGEASIASPDMSFPNGAVITEDGGTLIVGETFGGCLTAFDIASDGSLTNRRVWAPITGAVPDGICLDADDGIWVASPVSAEVFRVLEGGEVTDRIKVSTQAFACMLGGSDGKTLFVCTAGSSNPTDCAKNKDGRIEAFSVRVEGAGRP